MAQYGLFSALSFFPLGVTTTRKKEKLKTGLVLVKEIEIEINSTG